MEWADLQRALKGQRGRLISEAFSFDGPVRGWWTEDDVVAVSPYAEDPEALVWYDDRDPFSEWIYLTYTNPSTGKALLLSEQCLAELELRRSKSASGEFPIPLVKTRSRRDWGKVPPTPQGS